MKSTFLDLRGGKSLWEANNKTHRSHLRPEENLSADIIIIGAGISGSFLAERLSRLRYSIIVLDRHLPQLASTAASTALLQWEIDTPLRELASWIGFDKAAQVYHASIEAVASILCLVGDLQIPCHCARRRSLYLSGNEMGVTELADEQRVRGRAGISSVLLSQSTLTENFGFRRAAALLDEGCAEADPLALARGLMTHAINRGVSVFSPVTVLEYDLSRSGAAVLLDNGREVGAKYLILANGYEMPALVPSAAHQIVSTWALATEPCGRKPWPGKALVWEASDPYLYMRQTMDGRIIVGGEDEELLDAEERDQKIAQKTTILLDKVRELGILCDTETAYAWAGFFGTTKDGLPLIGSLPGHSNVYAAFGYGGNGITFSALAAQLIADDILGRRPPLLDRFVIDR